VPIGTRDEDLCFFPAKDDELFGIVTHPQGEPNGWGLLFVAGGLWLPSPGRNRIWVDMARRFASDGFTTMRFDYHGVGESSGVVMNYSLDEPAAHDTAAAARVLESQGVSSLILAGTCYGARSIMAALEHLPAVKAVALYAPPVRDFAAGHQFTSKPVGWFVRKAFTKRVAQGMFIPERRKRYRSVIARKVQALRRRRQRRREGQQTRTNREAVSPVFLRQLAGAIDRGVRLLFVYGHDDEVYADFHRAQRTRLRDLLDQAGDLCTVVEVPGKVHGMTSSEVQRHLVEVTAAWLPTAIASAATLPPPAPG
jgi:dienelactone hydrolase